LRTPVHLLLVVGILAASPVTAADGEGTAAIEPARAVRGGSLGTWTLTYTPGPEGLKPDGGIRVAFSGFPVRLFDTPQCEDPTAPAYTTARCSDPATPVEVSIGKALRGGWQDVQEVVVRVGATGLPPGQTLQVVYGDTSRGGPGGRVRLREGDDLPVRVYSDTDGDGKAAPIARFPTLTVIGGLAAKLVVCAPSQAVVGEPTPVSVSARDFRNDLAAEYPPAVTLLSDALAAPVQVAFPADPPGVAQAQVTFTRPGVHRLTAQPPSSQDPPITIAAADFFSSTRPQATAEPEFLPELVSVEVTATGARPGSLLRVRPHWRNSGAAAASADYRVSCHLERRPPQGRALMNWDHEPPSPTGAWRPGEDIIYSRTCPIARDVPPGDHALTLGLYRTPEPGEFTVIASFEVCRIHVADDAPLVVDMEPVRSNPIQVLPRTPERRLLWGDLHCHTEHSGDGSGSVRGLYTYARDVSRLDFCACSDHVGVTYPERDWQQIQQAARSFNEPGRFVSILGYEWSNMDHGDKNVYFVGDDEPIRVPRSGQAEDLWPMLEGVDCIVIPHHPAYPVGLRGTDWGRIDPSMVPVVEMCSAHGLAEHMGNPRPYGNNKPMGPSLPGGFAQDALARGLHLGFICSSDDHTGRAGKVGFLAAVFANSFDRSGIINALRARRCYGSTGARILLDVSAGGVPMGGEIAGEMAPDLQVEVHGTEVIECVQVVWDGEVCYTQTPGAETCVFTAALPPLTAVEHYVYVRVTQSDGEMAWTSPIFVRNTGALPQVPGPAASPRFRTVARERPPVPSGIGGLMSRPGLQVWRWPVSEDQINLFIRWGGDDEARDCAGELQLLDAVEYVCTPFHAEDDDTYTDSGEGTIKWQTHAEAGTGDGLNVWVKTDPQRPTRLRLDPTRGGQHRPAEVVTAGGPAEELPLELELVEGVED